MRRLVLAVAILSIFVLSGCVLITRSKWKESQEQVERLTLENEVLHKRLFQLEES